MLRCNSSLLLYALGMDMTRIGHFLSHLRKEKGISQDELAQQIYVSRQAISNWERGERLPDHENLLSLAEYYQISIDDILNGGNKVESNVIPHNYPSTVKNHIFVYAFFILSAVISLIVYFLGHSSFLSLMISSISISLFSCQIIRRRSMIFNALLQTAIWAEVSFCLTSIAYQHHFFVPENSIANDSYIIIMESFSKSLILDFVFMIILIFFFWHMLQKTKENGIQYIKKQIAIHHIINELYLCWAIILFAYFLHWMFPLLGVFSAICLPFVTAASVFLICIKAEKIQLSSGTDHIINNGKSLVLIILAILLSSELSACKNNYGTTVDTAKFCNDYNLDCLNINFHEISYDEFISLNSLSGFEYPILISRNDCEYCINLVSELNDLYNSNHFNLYILDSKKLDSKQKIQLNDEFLINSVPTLISIDNGHIHSIEVGNIDESTIKEIIK